MQIAQTILLAEDDLDDIAALKRVFTKARIRNPLELVSNGEEAIAYLAGDSPYNDRDRYPYPNLLLLDLRMPRVSGFDVLTWIRDHPDHHKLRVVVLTAAGDTRDIRLAYQLGADSFLTKPLLIDDFQNLLECLNGLKIEARDQGKYIILTPYPPPRQELSRARRAFSAVSE